MKKEVNPSSLKKRLLVILPMLILFFLSGVSAVSSNTPVLDNMQEFGIFKKDICVRIFQSGEGFTSCNITSIIYPNSTVAISESQMTKQSVEYNYSFCNTEILGDYIVNGLCTNGTDNIIWDYTFKVSTTGEEVSLSNIIIVIAFLVVGIFLFILGFSFSQDKWIIKSSFFLLALLFGLLAINSGKIIASESSGLSTMSMAGLTLIISITLVMFLYVFINWTVQTFEQLKNKKEIRWDY